MSQISNEMKIIIIGGGGHARVIADALMVCSNLEPRINLLGFLDDDPGLTNFEVMGKPVLGKIQDIGQICHDAVVIGIGDNEIRRELFERLVFKGEKIVSVIHPNAIISPYANIGQGVVAFAGVVVNAGSKIGDNVILNTASSVDHNCTIESHTHICPGVHLGGTVTVGEGAFIGIGSAVIPNKNIGRWSIVGAGSVIIKDVPDRTTVVGVPAQFVREKPKRTCLEKGSMYVVSIDSTAEWNAALVGAYDFYHLPFYHSIARDLNKGEPKLFVYQNDEFKICLPLLIRHINKIPTDELLSKEWYDASSVYGYAGPISSHYSIPERVRIDFQRLLLMTLNEMRVVSVFSRLHPLIDQEPILEGLGNIVFQGHTVSLDLNIPEESQIALYRGNHRRSLKHIKESGAICFVDEDFKYLDEFIDIYGQTMSRVGATEQYIFSRNYFQDLTKTQEAEVKLIVCMMGSEVICAGIFVKCGEILQYHLGGTSDSWLALSPTKLLLDVARHWGCEHGAKVFHLGGGVGTRDDTLLQFKLGFSDRRHVFRTWRWIINQSIYDKLVTNYIPNNSNKILPTNANDFFPGYRSSDGSAST
jgi:sugar O-acyltransferase (sialic acid O-acetyltransferase NeuD family)